MHDSVCRGTRILNRPSQLSSHKRTAQENVSFWEWIVAGSLGQVLGRVGP